MASPHILHMITPLKHMSPFDVNMAIDAGWDHVVPYAGVTLDEVKALVQDAVFSRAPQDGPRSGLFIAGKNAIAALDMVEEARAAMVPPFEMSVFADPAGSFTTAAAMVACVQRTLQARFQRTLGALDVAVFGATGVVGFCAAVIAAGEGAQVSLVGHDGDMRVKRSAGEMGARFNVRVDGVDGSSEDKRRAIVAASDVILCAGPAGVRVLGKALLDHAGKLKVAADVNAVPPAGIEGIGVHDDGVPINAHGALGIGALAIGNVKYQTESGLFRKMIASDTCITLDFRDAFVLARELAAK